MRSVSVCVSDALHTVLHIDVPSSSFIPHTPSLLQDKLNVKCTHVQALRLCTGRTAHRGSRGPALLFLDHGIRIAQQALRLQCVVV